MRSPSFAACLTIAGAVACAALLGARIVGTISFAEPLQVVTSGDEQSSLFAIWRVAHGESPYQDRFLTPYALASYNWLFYQVYGTVVRLVAAPDPWLPTVARLLTLAGAAVAGVSAYCAFGGGRPSLRAALAVLLAAGPLVGFWALTARPDVWAMALEIAGIALFLRLFRPAPWAAVAVAVALLYMAWAFKQTAILGAGAIGLFLLVRGRWALAVGFGGALVVAWMATFAIMDAHYRIAILYDDVPLSYTVERTLRNLGNFAIKSLPLLLPALAGIAVMRRFAWREAFSDDGFLLGALGSVLGLSIGIVSASQTGASENYYFIPAFFLALMLARWLHVAGEGTAVGKRLSWAAAAGFAATALLVGAVFAGVAGVYDLRDTQHRSQMAQKACLDGLPRPLFVQSRSLSLPWMVPGAEPFVLSDLYEEDRALGKRFADDGIGGRVAAGEFASLALMEAPVDGTFDGGSLAGYASEGSCAGMFIFRRR